jgi:integrase
VPAPAEGVALYLTALAATAKVSTLTRRLSALSQAHQCAGYASPTQDVRVRIVMAGIRRAKGTAPVGKRPVLTEDLRRILAALPDTLLGKRDRALLLLGFAGAFRRSELVALDAEDLDFGHEGVTVLVRRSKTDPEGQGRKVGIPYGSFLSTCPVRALRTWLEALGRVGGPLFCGINRHGQLASRRLSDKAVALIVKRGTGRIGLEAHAFGGHSLRAGLATAAASAGVPERAIMAQTGHRSLATLRRYIREGSLFLENAAARVGL